VRPVGDLPGEYRVCDDEPINLNVARNLAADSGREWLAAVLIDDGVSSPIYFLNAAGAEIYVPDTAINSYTPFPYTGNTIVPATTPGALGMDSGDQLIYAYFFEQGGVLNLNHIVFLTVS